VRTVGCCAWRTCSSGVTRSSRPRLACSSRSSQQLVRAATDEAEAAARLRARGDRHGHQPSRPGSAPETRHRQVEARAERDDPARRPVANRSAADPALRLPCPARPPIPVPRRQRGRWLASRRAAAGMADLRAQRPNGRRLRRRLAALHRTRHRSGHQAGASAGPGARHAATRSGRASRACASCGWPSTRSTRSHWARR
jgi:hypothetical protein